MCVFGGGCIYKHICRERYMYNCIAFFLCSRHLTLEIGTISSLFYILENKTQKFNLFSQGHTKEPTYLKYND